MLTNPTAGRRLAGRLTVVAAVAIALPLTATRAIEYVDKVAPADSLEAAPVGTMAMTAAQVPVAPAPPVAPAVPVAPAPVAAATRDGGGRRVHRGIGAARACRFVGPVVTHAGSAPPALFGAAPGARRARGAPKRTGPGVQRRGPTRGSKKQTAVEPRWKMPISSPRAISRAGAST